MHDQTISFLKNPYGFISEEAKKRKAQSFETRLLLRKTICMTGAEAAAFFYNPDYFMRKGAAPSPIKATLFGRGGLQDMDGVAHRRRKEMIMSLLTQEKITALGLLVREILRLESVRWSMRPEINFYEEAQSVITEAVCQWAGIPIHDENIKEKSADLTALFDRAGDKGLGHFIARAHRAKAESWIASVIRDVRAGKLIPEYDSPLAIISAFKDHRSGLLTEKAAAVELLNILRPTVAVSVYMVFTAHALSIFPESRPDLRSDESINNFLNEVRRYYPFFPAVSAKVRKTFRWNGLRFSRGERVMLDIFGTNHDSQFWMRPDEFMPSRFEDGIPHPFAFIPQGGGEAHRGHRCPGDDLAMEMMKHTLLFLTHDIDYTVPAQDLMIDFSRMPALPESHFKMSVVKLHYLNGGRSDSIYHFSHL